MTSDILEQLVVGYYQFKGYFTMENVKYLSGRQPGNHSDIDVIAIDPNMKNGNSDRVHVISCKSWQGSSKPGTGGFSRFRFARDIKCSRATGNIEGHGKNFGELVYKSWGDNLINKVDLLTGQKTFKYSIAVTRLVDLTATRIASYQIDFSGFSNMFSSTHPIDYLTLEHMFKSIYTGLGSGTTPQPTEIGRFVQLIKSAGLIKKVKSINQISGSGFYEI